MLITVKDKVANDQCKHCQCLKQTEEDKRARMSLEATNVFGDAYDVEVVGVLEPHPIMELLVA